MILDYFRIVLLSGVPLAVDPARTRETERRAEARAVKFIFGSELNERDGLFIVVFFICS